MTPATITPPPKPNPAPLSASPPAVSASGGWTPFRWTIAQYRDLYKTGWFRDVKTMLLDGEIFTMVMPNPPHDFSLTMAFRYLMSICPSDHYVRNQQGFDIGKRTDPGPDLAIVPGSPHDYVTRTPTAAVMIVEVSHTTLFEDMTAKAEWYATAGVPEYWVIDVNGRQLLVFRDPAPLPAGLGATAYRVHLTFGEAESVAPLAAPSSPVKVADLLP